MATSTTGSPASSSPPRGRAFRSGSRAGGLPAKPFASLRRDRWWVAPLTTFGVLLLFVVYTTWRAFENKHYYASPYISPFYSPCLAVRCVEGSSDLGTPVGSWYQLSPALLILAIPGGFRFTCYYYRKAYYRSFWLSPPACAVNEPHKKYTGESRFPMLGQNLHRFFFYLALLFNLVLTYDVILAFRNPEHEWGHMGVGTLVLMANAIFLWLYTLSCHSCRHAVGGRINSFSKHPMRYKAWTFISRLNARHMTFAWISLFGVALADLYVRQVSSGAITDFRFF